MNIKYPTKQTVMKTSNLLKTIILTLGVILLIQISYGQSRNTEPWNHKSKHSIDFSPLSPIFDIYALQYNYHLSQKDELIFGAAYLNIKYDFGNMNSPSLIAGYRRYLWKNLHLEYQLWPGYDNFYEKNEDTYHGTYYLWNEFRLGYRVDFQIANRPLYLNLQWPFGFDLYTSNISGSMREHRKKEPLFYFPPMFFLGFQL